VRFYPEEEKNDAEFAKKLAANADLYVNDAFGTAHRAHGSTEGVSKYLKPAVAGFLLQKELDYLEGAVSQPKRPFVAIVGGSKVSSKITVIESLLNKVDKLVIGGGMVFTFLKARGLKVGNSLVEEDKLELAKELEAMAKAKGVKLILPTDVVVADKFAPDANRSVSPHPFPYSHSRSSLPRCLTSFASCVCWI
jgi:phosphoglycerate kinase